MKTAIEQLVNTLAATFVAKVSKAEKINAVKTHAEHLTASVNGFLLANKHSSLRSADIGLVVKITIASFDAALRTGIDSFTSRDRTGRAYSLQNTLERFILTTILENEVEGLVNKAFEINYKEITWAKDGKAITIDFSNTSSIKSATNKIFKVISKNPYMRGSLHL